MESTYMLFTHVARDKKEKWINLFYGESLPNQEQPLSPDTKQKINNKK